MIIRIEIDTLPGVGKAGHGGRLTDWKGSRIKISRGQDNIFDLGIFHRGDWITGAIPWTSVKIALKQLSSSHPPSSAQTQLATVTTAISGSATLADWKANTDQHVRATMPVAQTASLLLGQTPLDLWMSIQLINAANQQQATVAAGRVSFIDRL